MIGEDYIIDRFRLKNSANRWRFFAILLLIAFVFLFVCRSNDIKEMGQDYIASVNVAGILMQNQEVLESLNKIGKKDNIKAVVVNINSPGGTAVGGESLYRAFREIAKKKPIVASIGELGTSAAYMAALGTDRIFAYESSLTGSIGVMLQNIEVSDLAKKYGINLELFKSSPLKNIPNHFEKLDNTQKKYVQSLINDSHQFFVQKVKQRKNFSDEELETIADGRVFIGIRAHKLRLVDQLGGKEEAIKWLKSNNDKIKNLKVSNIDLIKPTSKLQRLLDYSNNILLFFINSFSKAIV